MAAATNMRTDTARHTCISQNQSRILYRGWQTTTTQLARLYRSSYQHAQAQLARLCYQMTQTDVLPQVQRSVDHTSSRYCPLLLYTSKKKYLVRVWMSECTHMMLTSKRKEHWRKMYDFWPVASPSTNESWFLLTHLTMCFENGKNPFTYMYLHVSMYLQVACTK